MAFFEELSLIFSAMRGLLIIVSFFGAPLISFLGLFSCTVLCIAEKRDKKKKVLFGVLSLLSGIASAMLIYFYVQLANTPIAFM